MSTEGFAYGKQLPAARRRELAYGEVGPPPPDVAVEKETLGPLDRRTELSWASRS